MTTRSKIRVVWPLYIPPVGIGAVTVGAIILAHRIDAKRIVALTVASGISERALKEYKEKVIEKLGKSEDTKIRDGIAQDRVDKYPPKGNEIVIMGDGKVLCMDALTGRYFHSSAEALNRAINTINHTLNQQIYASLSEFYDEIGLEPTAYSNNVGWKSDKLVELKISATKTTDDRPCLYVELDPHPFPEYTGLHE